MHATAGSGTAREDRRIRVDLEPLHHLGLELPDPALAGLDGVDESQDACRPGLILLSPERRRGRLADPPQQLGHRGSARVGDPAQERGKPGLGADPRVRATAVVYLTVLVPGDWR